MEKIEYYRKKKKKSLIVINMNFVFERIFIIINRVLSFLIFFNAKEM